MAVRRRIRQRKRPTWAADWLPGVPRMFRRGGAAETSSRLLRALWAFRGVAGSPQPQVSRGGPNGALLEHRLANCLRGLRQIKGLRCGALGLRGFNISRLWEPRPAPSWRPLATPRPGGFTGCGVTCGNAYSRAAARSIRGGQRRLRLHRRGCGRGCLGVENRGFLRFDHRFLGQVPRRCRDGRGLRRTASPSVHEDP